MPLEAQVSHHPWRNLFASLKHAGYLIPTTSGEAYRLASRLDDEAQLERQFRANSRGYHPQYDRPSSPYLYPGPVSVPATGGGCIGAIHEQSSDVRRYAYRLSLEEDMAKDVDSIIRSAAFSGDHTKRWRAADALTAFPDDVVEEALTRLSRGETYAERGNRDAYPDIHEAWEQARTNSSC